jgi:hypothetical protein
VETFLSRGGSTIATVLLLASTACNGKDSTSLVPVASGGAGGAPSEAAGAGGSSEFAGAAGAAGAGGSTDEVPDAGSVRFHAALQGDKIILDVLDPAWHITCTHTPSVLQKLGDTWTPLRDERPTGSNDAITTHYLDGLYQSDCVLNSGCHINSCSPIIYDEQLAGVDDILRLGTREYVRVGERQRLSCDAADAGLDAGADAGLGLVPVIESRAPTGPLAVRVRYYRDSDCQTPPITTDVLVE